ncbi:MAG TPA: ABC transporter substrate-binding protein [Polyangiaceae bacterium LLY-WYZ-15_(1-7)]|nr:ABC transporter substrate-binding protein [Myxococcales bacterium]MAT25384.1 ABC transporter substrate-binding protein [Sandaracinus sp.]HJK92446.1 ABC transporter substrate-binding protein [Polyangiaceae bacterium LLY-WYZ-15_(1-7)]MBJ74586.1 ABC transporter substrate-binding protein [Sandaracinus sp.]HJL02948.1 ABC transporter substrate-binding protein [Polyangiaceae bacterium LLY-WYZ-15_(1-7)]
MITLRLGLEWFLNPDHLPFLVAQEKGWLKEAGLDLHLVEPQEHLDAAEAIQKGELDVAITEPLHLVEDRAQGRAVRGFARFLHTNGGVMYFAESGIERPRDMAGKRIQYPGAPGPGGPAIVGTMVEADGGRAPVDDFVRVNEGFHHTQALVDGKADVATLAFYNFELVEARHLGHDARFFALRDWGVPDFCQLVLFTTPRVLKDRRGALQALVKQLRRGIDFVHQHPEEARALYFRASGADPEDPLGAKIFAATAPCFTFDFSMSDDYFRRLASWMAERGLVASAPPPETLWTNEIAF